MPVEEAVERIHLTVVPHYPKEVLEIVRRAVDAHSGISDAFDQATWEIRRLPDFGNLVEAFVQHAILDLVHQARSTYNQPLKKAFQPKAPGKPKVIVGNNPIIQGIFNDQFEYMKMKVAGKILAEMTWEDLDKAENDAVAQTKGYATNAAFFRTIKRKVQPSSGMTVGQVLTERQLAALMKKSKDAADQLDV